jgi:hypothetical protein
MSQDEPKDHYILVPSESQKRHQQSVIKMI